MNKVLVIPSSECNALFDKLCSIGKKELGWDIVCIAPKYYLQYYKNFIDSENQLYDFPDLLEKASWESDPSQQNEIREIISASEKKIGIPINRVLLSCEKGIGRAYSKNSYYLPESRIARNTLKNNEFSNDMLLRGFKFVLNILREAKPNLCLGAPPAGILRLAFYYLTHYYDIPFTYSMFSMILPNRHYWSNGWGGFNDNVEHVFKSLKEKDHQPSKESIQYIDTFRNRPEPMPIYLSLWGEDKSTNGFLGMNKLILQRLMQRIVPILKNIKVSNPKPFFQFVLDTYRIAFLKRRQRKLYRRFSSDELKNFKYIYYPCHQEPEFVLSLRSPNWFDQLTTIKKLSYNLPYGYKLLVREHRYNAGRKRTAYLKEIIRYPGVVLVDGYDDQYKYINNADLVVTVNGTSGFEGLVLKKKVLTLDKTNYDVIVENSCRDRNSELGDILIKALKSENICDDNDIAHFMDAERETTFNDDETGIDEIHYILKMIDSMKTDERLEEMIC